MFALTGIWWYCLLNWLLLPHMFSVTQLNNTPVFAYIRCNIMEVILMHQPIFGIDYDATLMNIIVPMKIRWWTNFAMSIIQVRHTGIYYILRLMHTARALFMCSILPVDLYILQDTLLALRQSCPNAREVTVRNMSSYLRWIHKKLPSLPKVKQSIAKPYTFLGVYFRIHALVKKCFWSFPFQKHIAIPCRNLLFFVYKDKFTSYNSLIYSHTRIRD